MKKVETIFRPTVKQAYTKLLRENGLTEQDVRYWHNCGWEDGFVYEGNTQELKMPKGYELRGMAKSPYLCKVYSIFGKPVLYKPLFYIKDCRNWDWKTMNDPSM